MADHSNDLQNIVFPPVDYEAWKKEAEKTLKGKTVEQLYTSTYENIKLKPIYTKDDIQNITHVKDLPGNGSHVRGSNSSGYTNQSWLISQEIVTTSTTEFNQALTQALQNGQTMINLVLQKGAAENGLSLRSIKEFSEAFKGISLETYPVFVDTYSSCTEFMNLLHDYLTENGILLSSIKGTVGMDPLGTLADEGGLSTSLAHLYTQMAESIRFVQKNNSGLRTILIKGHPYHNGGANAVQELAFTLAAATEYCNQLQGRGLTIDEISPRITFAFSIGSNVFMEIAKLRAARILWSTIIAAFGGDEKARIMNIHARTSRFTKTVTDPYVNMLRSTTEAFSAIIGGIESLHVSAFDEPIKLSDTFSRRIARNTQSILKEESHLNRVIDPAGGSYYIEALTNQIAEDAWRLFKDVEEKGGMEATLHSGFVQQEIANILIERQNNVNIRRDRIVGTNMYANIQEKAIIEFPSLSKEGSKQISNDGPSITRIPQLRISEGFESLREKAYLYMKQTGMRPKIGLINLGPIPSHKARADFITGFFEAGGFEVVKNNGYLTVDAAIEGVGASNLTFFVFCGTDELYSQMVEEIATQVKKSLPEVTLFVAGKQPSDTDQSFTRAGIRDFIHVKTDCYTMLYNLQSEMGVSQGE